MRRTILLVIVCCAPLAPLHAELESAKSPGVDHERIVGADAEPGNWLSHGRTYAEERYSPLTQINAKTVGNLGLAWAFDLETQRGLEATPLAIDGILYFTGTWSVTYAVDGATGKLLWRHDPQVPRSVARKVCCDVVNRGVAAWQDKIFVGTLDGRLIALHALDGRVAWSTMTVNPEEPYSITGAPRVIRGKVIIGNGGAEYGVRGYVDAYDAETGARLWRFHTVPGNPADGFENPTMERIAETWSGEWWRLGGGGTVWDSMAYDPDLDLLYIGVGNGTPWNRRLRSPGGGDNLFLSSIVALRPGKRRIRLALSGGARRNLGLHRHPAHDPGRDRVEGPAPQGAHAGPQERLLHDHRSGDRGIPFGRTLCRGHLGKPLRSRYRTTRGKSR